MGNPNRKPSGTPQGGEWAQGTKTEADGDIGAGLDGWGSGQPRSRVWQTWTIDGTDSTEGWADEMVRQAVDNPADPSSGHWADEAMSGITEDIARDLYDELDDRIESWLPDGFRLHGVELVGPADAGPDSVPDLHDVMSDATDGWDVHGEVWDRWSAGFARWVGAYSDRLERASPTLFSTEAAEVVEHTDRHTAAQFAARLDTDCRGQESGPAWAFVEVGQVRGVCGDNQCGNCGKYGEGWYTSEVLVDPEPGEAADALKRFETETHDLREQQADDAADEALRGVETGSSQMRV